MSYDIRPVETKAPNQTITYLYLYNMASAFVIFVFLPTSLNPLHKANISELPLFEANFYHNPQTLLTLPTNHWDKGKNLWVPGAHGFDDHQL